MSRRSIEFFDAQFRRQILSGEFELNPFEMRALEHLTGTVLDIGCGLGNLAVEAARRGHRVVAVDASQAAIARIDSLAKREGLPIRAEVCDLAGWRIDGSYSTIVAIGLLMFFPRERSLELLRGIQDHVRPGGTAIVNVLVEGTTYLEMFQPGGYCLYGASELEARFTGWKVLSSTRDSFAAPGDTHKVFSTLIVEKPLP